MSEMTWGIPVVAYLFLAGLGAGSFCLGTIASRRKGPGWEACARMAFLVTPLALAAGLLMLIFDLGHPSRFWRTLTVLNTDSPMSVGVWLLVAFFLVSAAAAMFWLPERQRGRMPWIGRWSGWNRREWVLRLGIIGMPLALLVPVYTGVLLSVTVIPLWRNFSLPVLFFLSALSLGIEGGAVLGLLSLRKTNFEAMKEPLRFMKDSYRLLLPLYLFAAFLFILSIAISPASRSAALHFMKGWSGLIWWVGVVGIGILVPLTLVMRKGAEPLRHAWFLSVCLMSGDFLLRLVLILAGQGAL